MLMRLRFDPREVKNTFEKLLELRSVFVELSHQHVALFVPICLILSQPKKHLSVEGV